MTNTGRQGDEWMTELLGESAVIWQGAPDPRSFVVGRKRATEAKLVRGAWQSRAEKAVGDT